MIKRKIYLFIFLSILFLISCSSGGLNYQSDRQNTIYKKIALEKLTADAQFMFSPDSNYVICYKMDETDISPQLHFFIFDLNTDKVLFEDTSRSDKIEWLDNSKLKVLKRPGIISVNPSITKNMEGYIYDVKLRKKLPLHSFENINN